MLDPELEKAMDKMSRGRGKENRMCRSFTTCSCPLCPDDPDMGNRIWYPGEPICGRGGVVSHNQRQLKSNPHRDEYYTGEMLAELREGLNDENQHGIDPGLSLEERETAVKTWLVQNRGSLKSNKIGGVSPPIPSPNGLG